MLKLSNIPSKIFSTVSKMQEDKKVKKKESRHDKPQLPQHICNWVQNSKNLLLNKRQVLAEHSRMVKLDTVEFLAAFPTSIKTAYLTEDASDEQSPRNTGNSCTLQAYENPLAIIS